jgi:hypothetical protein
MSKGAGNNAKGTLYCSFCGKSQHEVGKLIAGPTVFICDAWSLARTSCGTKPIPLAGKVSRSRRGGIGGLPRPGPALGEEQVPTYRLNLAGRSVARCRCDGSAGTAGFASSGSSPAAANGSSRSDTSNRRRRSALRALTTSLLSAAHHSTKPYTVLK